MYNTSNTTTRFPSILFCACRSFPFARRSVNTASMRNPTESRERKTPSARFFKRACCWISFSAKEGTIKCLPEILPHFCNFPALTVTAKGPDDFTVGKEAHVLGEVIGDIEQQQKRSEKDKPYEETFRHWNESIRKVEPKQKTSLFRRKR
ncbi:hypothetical protein K402DRAFT_262287 [Aulographum hederae CBS 113979]|uniref:Uncharacterized protein n=1 Tax=Aulographum hederae CBS 113979 TaxID=1176131 RepID=A0A6G1H9I5_9PEZI|nr:hypothetical protein K402DRAFT_262287 [Aulographum hederae CBS 113979]